MRPGGQVQALVFRRLRPVYGSLCWSVMCLPAWSLETWLVSWCFEPSQPQRIISGLEINFSPSPTYPDRLMALWAQSTTKDYIKAEKKKQASICLLVILYTSHQATNSPESTESVPTQIHTKRTHTNTKFSKNESLEYCPCLKKKKKAYKIRTRWNVLRSPEDNASLRLFSVCTLENNFSYVLVLNQQGYLFFRDLQTIDNNGTVK